MNEARYRSGYKISADREVTNVNKHHLSIVTHALFVYMFNGDITH